MNSAEKKAQEPSMDDIISSIRNIIADDTQESASAPSTETTAAPVIQLTENQIAEPVVAPAVEEAVPVENAAQPVAPEGAPVPQPEPLAPLAEAQVATPPDAVPTIQEPPVSPAAIAEVAPQVAPAPVPAAALTPDPVAAIEAAPVASAPEPSAPASTPPAPMAVAPEIATPVAAPETAVAEIASVEQSPEPVVPVTAPQAAMPEAAPAAIEKVAVADPLAPIGDMAETTLEAEPGISNETVADNLAGSAVTETSQPASDPVEQMMQDAASAPGDIDAASNDVDPDQILEGMESQAAAPTASDNLVPEPELKVEAIPAVLENPPEEPIVLDASQVTPEDAAAITAVAAATSDALAGKTAPVEKPCGGSFEDSVKEMLKPMIREWLNDNMPRILEGAVKEEVKAPEGDGS